MPQKEGARLASSPVLTRLKWLPPVGRTISGTKRPYDSAPGSTSRQTRGEERLTPRGREMKCAQATYATWLIDLEQQRPRQSFGSYSAGQQLSSKCSQ